MDDPVLNVLVVENNPTILKLISHHLTAEGCQVKTATDGLAALLQLDLEIPDILFTDIIMPKVSGDQLCNIVRKDKNLKDLFIAVHSSTSLEDNRQILDLDADVYIAKGPIINLREHVLHVLQQYRQGIRRDKKTIGGESLYPREITRELLLARKHYQAIFDNVAEAIVELDCMGKIVQANRATLNLLNKTTLEILSSNFLNYLEGKQKSAITKWIEEIKQGGATEFKSSYDQPIIVNGRKILLNMVAIEEANDFFITAILQDITLQKNTEEKLARTLAEFDAVTNTIDYGILLMDKDLRARIVNQAYRNLWKLPETYSEQNPSLEEIIMLNATAGQYNLTPGEIPDWVAKRVEAVRQGAIPPMELRRSDGKVLQFECVELPDNGRLLTYYDISSLKNTEEKLEEALEKVSRLANHDPLTGLPNLRLARERLLSAISLSKRKGWMAAIMFIDLDGFKSVNDSHGHDIGDKVLQVVAERLVASLRETDTVARIGGDEFLVIQTEVPHRFAAANVAEKIVKNLAQEINIDDLVINIGASIGISIYPEDGQESRVLMKKADDAMYYTKRIGKNNYTFSPS